MTDPKYDSPFDDPSVVQYAKSVAEQSPGYNPFDSTGMPRVPTWTSKLRKIRPTFTMDFQATDDQADLHDVRIDATGVSGKIQAPPANPFQRDSDHPQTTSNPPHMTVLLRDFEATEDQGDLHDVRIDATGVSGKIQAPPANPFERDSDHHHRTTSKPSHDAAAKSKRPLTTPLGGLNSKKAKAAAHSSSGTAAAASGAGGHNKKFSSSSPLKPSGAETNQIVMIEAAADIKRREADLAEREAAFDRRVKNLEARILPELNWPFRWKPIAYHDIRAEIPMPCQPLVTLAYRVWILSFATLLINWLAITVWWWTPGANCDGCTLMFFFSGIYLVAGSYLGWHMWYRKLYYACSNSQTRKWLMFFFNFGLMIGFSAIMAIGIPGWGSAGFINMLDAFSRGSSGVGMLMLVGTVFWALLVLGAVYTIKQAHGIWHSTGSARESRRQLGQAALRSTL